MAIGLRALPCDSIPLSKFTSLSAVFLFGPKTLVRKMMAINNTIAKINCIPIGK